ncbi:MarR family transcriptional regulator [Halobacillus sp. A1]|uniref:MarR family winged helix-turn-helix transcriptional regulator n=1 Tax=Halobacillus sp. A1 TaxID=2880262 RepID=UPI0020A668A6|nr:MarR family transcriptional regulator [Halobacillus sp. A1]MCP3029755.1 MarR family transcriptional regulator [Halobacillus sp. A1]
MQREIEPLLGYNFNVISHFIQNKYNRKLSEYGLTSSQAKVIYFLSAHGSQNQTDLQNRLYIKASSMNGIIESLIKNECITKESSKEDKRTKVIHLTDKGEKLEQTIWSVVLELEEEIGEGITKEEQHVMISLMKKIQQNMRPDAHGGGK